MKHILLTLLLSVGLVVGVNAQITVPNTLVAGTTIAAAALNTNFTTIANHSLDRLSGGNLSGNVTADALITFDGVDVGVQACVTCNPTHAKLVLTDTSATSLTVGGGITAGTGTVALVTAAGKITAISSTYFASLSGANLTGFTAAQFGSGSPDATTYLRGDLTWVSAIGCVPAYTAKTTTYAAVACDHVSATSGSFTVTLPAASSNAGKMIWIANNGTGTLTVGHSGSDTVALASTFTLNAATASTQGDSGVFVSDGISNWNLF